MEKYTFNSEHNKMIVEAIVEGYREYIEHRKERRQVMKISSAFAWTKGNFIESKIAEEWEKIGFTCKKSKAGLTWDYLQFIRGKDKVLFLIKNAVYFNEQAFSHSQSPSGDTKGNQRTYLHELSKINKDIDFPEVPQNQETNNKDHLVQLQLEFFITARKADEELANFKSNYKEFHILTYTLDEAHQISKIKHYLPNPHNNIAYLVEDLSDFIAGAELTEEDRKVIAPEIEDELMDPAAFDLGIIEEEQTEE